MHKIDNNKLQNFDSYKMVSTPQPLSRISYLIGVLLLIFIIALVFLPWQQNVTAEGSVTIFSPTQRPQTVNSLIDARIKEWHVKEGDIVHRGDLLVELDELHPSYLDALQLERLLGQKSAYYQKRAATERLINSYENQIDSYSQYRRAAIPQAQVKVKQSTDKYISSEQDVKKAEQDLLTADLNYKRREDLYKKGLVSKRDLELAEQSYVKAKADLESEKAKLQVSQNDIRISELDTESVNADTAIKVQDAEAKLASTFEKLASINADIFKLDTDVANLENRIIQRKLLAPIDGQVTRIVSLGLGETVKAGEEMIIIVPESSDQAVELYVDDYNIPLIDVGRKVRLQFSGFPAFQFAGWPSVATGTFGGVVSVIDNVNDKSENSYRILVKPDKQRIKKGLDNAWPDTKFLRPGTKVVGWVLLDNVPLWYELWRVFNGFPPTVLQQSMNKTKRKAK